MIKPNISRRAFVKGLTTGAISATIIPVWSCDRGPKSGRKLKPGDEQPVKYLPPFFDCNKYIGPGFPNNPDFPGVADLINHMDRLGIDKAVAWHTAAKAPRPMAGNEQLIREITSAGANERIIPSFIIDPSMSKEPGVIDHFLDLVKDHNIRAFHFFPKISGCSLKDIRAVLQTILPNKPVLFLDSFQNLGDDLESIISFAEEFKQVSFVFTNAMWTHLLRLYKLMESKPNFFVDTSLMHTYNTIEYVTRKFGPERLIFGTGYKSNNGASIASLAHSEINAEQAGLIAHGNLEKLLGSGIPLSGQKPVIGERLWHRLLRKEPLGPKIIDAHTHFCSTLKKWEDPEPVDFDTHVKHSLKSMDSMGVGSMIIAEYEASIPGSPEAMTFLEERLSKYGERFKGYFCAQAFLPEYKGKVIPMLDNIFSRTYYVGFKMHNDHWNVPVTDPCFNPMWEYANAHRLPVLLHTWNTKYNAPKMLENIVPRYPNAIFILGHSGNTDRPDAEKLAVQNKNVYLEWCGSFMDPEDWRETLNRMGNRKLIYGSDGVSWETLWGHNPAWEMGRLLSLDLPDETFIPILSENMEEILSMKR